MGASLTITAKVSLKRHQIFNDVWRHCHQSLSMTSFVIVIIICRHRLILSCKIHLNSLTHFNKQHFQPSMLILSCTLLLVFSRLKFFFSVTQLPKYTRLTRVTNQLSFVCTVVKSLYIYRLSSQCTTVLLFGKIRPRLSREWIENCLYIKQPR